ncbi:MAG: S-methyl-5-thioribose-1-phosphate isomerase [Actinomycetota bacterium]
MGNRDIARTNVPTLIWEDGLLKLIDQRKLPFEEVFIECRTSGQTAKAIKDMVVRGAPAIGVTAAYGVAIAALEYEGKDKEGLIGHVKDSIQILGKTRPTAVNLFWALDRMNSLIEEVGGIDVTGIKERLVAEAKKIEKEDILVNKRLGENGLKAFSAIEKKKLSILTHCNAGALATAGYGTALGVVRKLDTAGRIAQVIVDETRPYLQGARLTSWELYREGIKFFVITDNMAAYFMSTGDVDAVVVGADRIASNGDTANKIGTLGLSILAKNFGIPFFVAAPVSTIDFKIGRGQEIEIEKRNPEEVRKVAGSQIIPDYMAVENPAFDVSPAENITAIITEKGVLYPPYKHSITKLKSREWDNE